MTRILPLARGTLDSLTPLRELSDLTERAMSGVEALAPFVQGGISQVSAFLIDDRGNVAVADHGDALALWRADVAEALAVAGPRGGENKHTESEKRPTLPVVLLIGRTTDGRAHFAVRVPEGTPVAGARWGNLRWLAHELSDDDSAVAVAAVGLVEWHQASRFCARCGQKVQVISGGWVTRCEGCGHLEYPRQDPAVIMAVFDEDDRLLLAHNRQWPQKHWSILAGFIEVGESPDRAVKREVIEEVGIDVDDVTYVGSQPWPFPRSLMLGFTARVAHSGLAVPRPDLVEIECAQFFTRKELKASIDAGDIEPPSSTAIARSIMEEWYGDSLPYRERPLPCLSTF